MRTVTAMAKPYRQARFTCGPPGRWSAGRAEPGHPRLNDTIGDPGERTVIRVRVLIALDKFRGTATAHEATAAVGHACWELGHDGDEAPMSDGGEGAARRARRRQPDVGGDGTARRAGRGAVAAAIGGRPSIEMAMASGLVLAGGPDGNDPLRASTTGTGRADRPGPRAGADRIVVGLGGSATTDGGLGAIEALRSPARLRSVELERGLRRAHAVPRRGRRVRPAEGGDAGPGRVAHPPAWQRLADRYREEYGVDVTELDGGGAAGGLGGGLAAARRPAAVRVRPRRRRTSSWTSASPPPTWSSPARATSTPRASTARWSAGSASWPRRGPAGRGDRRRRRPGRPDGAVPATAVPQVLSLVERYGEHRARTEPRWCIEHAAADALGGR